ncbi:MAG: ATP-binding cassette domain-containing protein, partial [Candidatus Omnitrophota bacterium]
PSQLSGGEAQRVAIARALMNSPDIVLCDEPTGNLDSETSAVVLEMVKKLNTDFKQTFLLVTHNEEVSSFSGRVVYLKDGVMDNKRK